jgi:hypothetical protein
MLIYLSPISRQVFSIHPLTTEDIQMEETREKIELFRNYYFVCFRSFDQDQYSPTYLEPLNMYIIVFREGILSVRSLLLCNLTQPLTIATSSTFDQPHIPRTSDDVSNNSKITSTSPLIGSPTRSSMTSQTHSGRSYRASSTKSTRSMTWY